MKKLIQKFENYRIKRLIKKIYKYNYNLFKYLNSEANEKTNLDHFFLKSDIKKYNNNLLDYINKIYKNN